MAKKAKDDTFVVVSFDGEGLELWEDCLYESEEAAYAKAAEAVRKSGGNASVFKSIGHCEPAGEIPVRVVKY